MEKFTKGKWKIRFNLNVESEKGRLVASTGGYNSNIDGENVDEENRANAKLIASAPEMLEALKEVREWYEQNASKIIAPSTPICFSKALSAIINATK